MNIKKVSIVALLALAAAPLTSQAGTAGPGAAFDACVKAFVATYLPNHPIKQTQTSNAQNPTTIAFWQPRKYTIALSARGVRSGDVLAEARCVADNNGIVLILDTPPVSNYVASADFVATLR
jgi:hypothetical protein